VDELQYLALHKHIGAHGDNLLLQGANEFQTSAVTHVSKASVLVATEVTLEDLAVLGAVKECAPLLKLKHALWCFLGVEFGHAVVVEVLSTAHGVAEVDLPVVFGVDVTHGGSHATFGHNGVRLTKE